LNAETIGLLSVVIGVLSFTTVLQAQSTPTAGHTFERVFVGIGVMCGTDDSEHRVTLPGSGTSGSPIASTIDAGVWLSHRVGIGVEYLKPSTVELDINSIFGSIVQTERETVFAVTGRVRAARLSRATVDLTAGLGPLWQDWNTTPASCCSQTVATSQEKTRAGLAGVDISVLLAPHFAIAPVARVYWFSRNSNRDWPHYGSSTRLLAGLLASAVW
jgi:hypothetical protein